MAERWETYGEEALEDEPVVDNPDRLLHEVTDRSVPPESIPEQRAHEIEWAFWHSPEIEEYRKGGITIDDVEAGGSVLEKNLTAGGVDAGQAEKAIGLHVELVQGVKDSVARYARSVRSFSVGGLGLEGALYRSTVRDRDQARRTAHDAYIGSLRTYNRFMSAKLHKEYGFEAPDWTLFPEAMFPAKSSRRTPARGPSEQWALATDYYLRVRELVRHLKATENKTEQGRTPAPESEIDW